MGDSKTCWQFYTYRFTSRMKASSADSLNYEFVEFSRTSLMQAANFINSRLVHSFLVFGFFCPQQKRLSRLVCGNSSEEINTFTVFYFFFLLISRMEGRTDQFKRGSRSRILQYPRDWHSRSLTDKWNFSSSTSICYILQVAEFQFPILYQKELED